MAGLVRGIYCKGVLNPGQVKIMINTIDKYNYLLWRSTLMGSDWDWLAQYQDNIIEWIISGDGAG